MPNQCTPKRQPIFVVGPSIAYIPLTMGQFACVDDHLAADLCQWNWTANWSVDCRFFYAKRLFRGRHVSMHGWILGLSGKTITADHINLGNGLDNRQANLRPANQAFQNANTRIRKDNTSGAKGVYWHKQSNKWHVQMRIGGRNRSFGRYADKELAVRVAITKRKEIYGDSMSS